MKIPLRNTRVSYGVVSQFFHWLIVALLLIQYTWAWRIDSAEGFRARLELVTQHKTIGMVVLTLAILRLAWRLFIPPPEAPPSLQKWERFAARLTHWLLYGLIFAMPLSGWLYSSAAGLGAFWWGPVSFPGLIDSNERLEDFFGQMHRVLAALLAAVAGLHVLAALRHHFIKKDEVLKRMLPIWSRK